MKRWLKREYLYMYHKNNGLQVTQRFCRFTDPLWNFNYGMKNLDGYLNMMKWFFGLTGICLIGGALFFPLLIVYGPMLAVMGVVQLFEGVGFALKSGKPQWFTNGLRGYWAINGIYFILLAFMVNMGFTEHWLFYAWLFLVPWAIAIYQYQLVWRLKQRQAAKMAKSLFEAEQIEQGLNHSF